MLAVSVPLSYPVGIFVLGLLPPFDLPEGQFWRCVDDLVLDMPVKWGFVATAPVALILKGGLPQTILQTIVFSCAAWIPIAAAYSWITRRVRMLYVLLGVYPII